MAEPLPQTQHCSISAGVLLQVDILMCLALPAPVHRDCGAMTALVHAEPGHYTSAAIWWAALYLCCPAYGYTCQALPSF